MSDKSYHIETLAENGFFNFFTKAADQKEALERLLKKSNDYKRLVKTNGDLTIKIKLIDGI